MKEAAPKRAGPPPLRRGSHEQAAPESSDEALTTPPPLSEERKEAIAIQALDLLEEQLQARIVHYKSELETSPELDAITAQVVAQLKTMQAQAAAERPAPRLPPEQIEAQQTRTLSSLLTRIFPPDGSSSFLTQVLKPLGRRIAKLFFESELHEKTRGDKDKVIHHAEQGVYYVLQRYTNRLRGELDGFAYVNADIREMTYETLAKIERDLQMAFLSRRSPELNQVMQIFASVLTEFFQHHLPSRIDQMAKLAIKNSRTAHRPNSVPYKVLADAFPDFRLEWERLLMQQMVHFCGDELMARLTGQSAQFREETIKFFSDPHIFSESCEVICDRLYDHLCLEGLLDLPVDWRVQLARGE